MQPKVSVIIPCYNYGRFLPLALESVLQQDMADWECIVVDDGSSDDTGRIGREFVAKDGRFKYIFQQNRGLSAARNTGIENSRGLYIQFLDADDLLAMSKFSFQSNYLDNHADCDIVYGEGHFFHSDSPEKTLKGRNAEDNKYDYLKISGRGSKMIRAFTVNNFIPVSAPLVRKSLIERVGVFDTTYRSYEDWHFWFRAAFAGAGFQYQPREGTETLIRFGHTSMLSDTVRIIDAGIALRIYMMPKLGFQLKLYNAYRIARLRAHKLSLLLRK